MRAGRARGPRTLYLKRSVTVETWPGEARIWYPTYGMRKTSVYLSDEDAEQLRRASLREGLPQAELIRAGVRHVIAESGADRREFHSLGKGRGGGESYERWDPVAVYDKTMGKP